MDDAHRARRAARRRGRVPHGPTRTRAAGHRVRAVPPHRVRGGLGDARRPRGRRRHAARHRVPGRGAVGRHVRGARRDERVRHGRRLGERVLGGDGVVGWAPDARQPPPLPHALPAASRRPPMGAMPTFDGDAAEPSRPSLRDELGVAAVGDDRRGPRHHRASRATDRPALPRARRPRRVPGFLSSFWRSRRTARPSPCTCRATCSPTSAADYVEREQPAWQAWLDGSRRASTGDARMSDALAGARRTSARSRREVADSAPAVNTLSPA